MKRLKKKKKNKKEKKGKLNMKKKKVLMIPIISKPLLLFTFYCFYYNNMSCIMLSLYHPKLSHKHIFVRREESKIWEEKSATVDLQISTPCTSSWRRQSVMQRGRSGDKSDKGKRMMARWFNVSEVTSALQLGPPLPALGVFLGLCL